MRRSLLAAAAGAAMALLLAPAVRAQQPLPPPDATITVTDPKPDQAFGGPAAASGSVHATGVNGATVAWVKAALAWAGPGGPPPMPSPRAICGPAPAADPNPDKPTCQGGADVGFTNAPLPMPPFNGPYVLVVTAHVSDGVGQQNDITRNTVKYAMGVPPPNVSNFKASAKNRVVTLGWDREVGTADLVGYDVFRAAPGEKAPTTPIVRVAQTDSGTRVSFIDDTAPAAGGEYKYAVLAVRPGGSGDIKTSLVYSPSAAVVKVTLPAGTPTATTRPPTGPTGSPAGPPVIKGTGSNAPRLSSATAANSPSTTEAVVPDPGFVRNLPYGATTVPGDEGEGDASVAINQPSGGKSKSNQRGLLVPAAVGSILFVGAFQLRWLKNRLDEPVGTPLN